LPYGRPPGNVLKFRSNQCDSIFMCEGGGGCRDNGDVSAFGRNLLSTCNVMEIAVGRVKALDKGKTGVNNKQNTGSQAHLPRMAESLAKMHSSQREGSRILLA
jgi:hypothetical protein